MNPSILLYSGYNHNCSYVRGLLSYKIHSMYKVIKKDETILHKIAQNKKAMNYITKEVTPHVSLALIEAEDYLETETTAYNRIYFVTEGKMYLTFEGVKHVLDTGDSCFIAKGTSYQMGGTFKTLVINQPAFGI